mmetsp:Transcript_52468/g.77690  ORF Transcript_52468/g.77690 Transcript_52468/m.77690 type:complete len:207 (-) Transcript_52468:2561-3181(-)
MCRTGIDLILCKSRRCLDHFQGRPDRCQRGTHCIPRNKSKSIYRKRQRRRILPRCGHLVGIRHKLGQTEPNRRNNTLESKCRHRRRRSQHRTDKSRRRSTTHPYLSQAALELLCLGDRSRQKMQRCCRPLAVDLKRRKWRSNGRRSLTQRRDTGSARESGSRVPPRGTTLCHQATARNQAPVRTNPHRTRDHLHCWRQRSRPLLAQ